MGKFLCFIGWHRWSWRLSELAYVGRESTQSATCKRCKVRYKGRI